MTADGGGGAADHVFYLFAVPGRFLANVFELYGARLLGHNARTFLQAETKVNSGIVETLETRPEMFFAFNNGLTATATGTLGIPAIQDLQIVNGARR